MATPTEKALSRLAYQFTDSERLIVFLESILAELDELEVSRLQLDTERYIDTAIGVQLDGIGEILGLPRPVLDGVIAGDDPYRLLLRAKTKINSTSMTVPETLEIIAFMISSVTIQYRLVVSMFPSYLFNRILTETEIFALSLLPSLIGIGPEFIHYDDPNTFSFFEDPTGKGFGTTADAGIGGNMASIITF